jgi:hypothetical protein
MKKIQIEVSESALKKIDEIGIKYQITNSDVNLERLLTSCNSVADLSDYEISKILNMAKKAIKKGTDYGISIETTSGRDMNDHRCYTLDEVCIVSFNDDSCTHTVAELIKHSN